MFHLEDIGENVINMVTVTKVCAAATAGKTVWPI